jgi:hypothetical protein
VPSLVERVTVAAVFAWPPAEPALDAAGGGSGPRDGGIRGVPPERIFGSHDVTSTPSGADNDIVPFNPKHVVMEVFGPPATVATITYLDVNAQPQRGDAVTLPWACDTATTQPAVFANVSAQGNSNSIGCRIEIDDVVKDKRR